MTDTTKNLKIDKGVWVDIYDLSGISVGTKIEVINVGSGSCRLYAGAAAPTGNEGVPLLVYGCATNESSDAGAFIKSEAGTMINVKEVAA